MLVHPRVLFRNSLARILAEERGFRAYGRSAAELALEGLQVLAEAKPDVILLDFAIWKSFVADSIRESYEGRFLTIAEGIDPALCARALSHGVSGVFLGLDFSAAADSGDSPKAADGDAWVDLKIIQLPAERYPHHEDLRIDGLTVREQAVLRGILDGMTNRKIADQIGTSEATVKAVIQHLFEKTGVRTRSQLVRIMLAESASDAPAKTFGGGSGGNLPIVRAVIS